MSKRPAQNGKTRIEAPKLEDAVAAQEAQKAAIAIISIEDPKLRAEVLSVLKKAPSGEDEKYVETELTKISSRLKNDNTDKTRVQTAALNIQALSSNGLSQETITRLITDQIFDIEIKKTPTIGIQTNTEQGQRAETALNVAAKSYDSIIKINDFPSETTLLVSESYKKPTTNRHFQKDAQEMLANAKSPEAAEKAFTKLCKEYKFSPDSQDEKSKRSFFELRKLTDSFIELSFGVNAANMRALDSYKPSIADEVSGIDKKKIESLTKHLTEIMHDKNFDNLAQQDKQQRIELAYQKKAKELGINTDSKASEYLQSRMMSIFVGKEKDWQGLAQSPQTVMSRIVESQNIASKISLKEGMIQEQKSAQSLQNPPAPAPSNTKNARVAAGDRGFVDAPLPPQQSFGPISPPGLTESKPAKPPRSRHNPASAPMQAPQPPKKEPEPQQSSSLLQSAAGIYPEPPKQPTREGIAAPDIKETGWGANADAGMMMTTVLEKHKDKLGLTDQDTSSFNSVRSTEDVLNYIKENPQIKTAINENPDIKKELEQELTKEYRNAFNSTQTQEINWSSVTKSNDGVSTLELPDKKSELKITTINQNTTIEGKNITSYRSIDFPAEVEANHPMKISMALQDKDGKNMPADKAIFFEAIYDEKGKLLDVNAPEGVKFTKEGVGYIEKEGEIYTLPVKEKQYKKMRDLAAKNKAEIIGLNEPTQERQQEQAQIIDQGPKVKAPEVAADQIAVAQAPEVAPRSEELSSAKVGASPAQPDSPELELLKQGMSEEDRKGFDKLPKVDVPPGDPFKASSDEQLQARLDALSHPSGKAPSQDLDSQSVVAETTIEPPAAPPLQPIKNTPSIADAAPAAPAAEIQELKPQAAASPAASPKQNQRPEPKNPDNEFLKMPADEQAAHLNTTIKTSQNLSVAIFKFNSAGDPQNYVGDSLASNPQVDILLSSRLKEEYKVQLFNSENIGNKVDILLSSRLKEEYKVQLFNSENIENKADIVKSLMLQSDASTGLYPNAKEAGELAQTLFKSASLDAQAAIFAVTVSADKGRAKELMESLKPEEQKALIKEIKEGRDTVIDEPPLQQLVNKDKLEQAIKDLDATPAGQALRKAPPPARSAQPSTQSASVELGGKRPPLSPTHFAPKNPYTPEPPSPLRGEELMKRAIKGQQELLDAVHYDEIPSKSNWEKFKDSLQSAWDTLSRKDTKNLDQQETRISQTSDSTRNDDELRQQGAAQTTGRDQSVQLARRMSTHISAKSSTEPSPPRVTPPVSRQNSQQQGRGNNNEPTR